MARLAMVKNSFGPFQGEMFLLIVDAHSKWPHIYPVKTATSQATIEKVMQSFITFGLPKMGHVSPVLNLSLS